MAIDIDEAKVQRNEAGLWFGWSLATAVGMLLGLLPFIFIVDNLDLLLVRILIPLWAGFLVGLFQWLVLRRYLENSVDWIWHDGAGLSLGYALGLVVIQLLAGSAIGALVGYVLFGIIIGVIQYPVFRREIPNILPWILASVIGWALGAFLSQLVLNGLASAVEISQFTSTAVISGITGLIAGAVTGIALIWLVRQPEV